MPFEVRFAGEPVNLDLDTAAVRSCHPSARAATPPQPEETPPTPEEPEEGGIFDIFRMPLENSMSGPAIESGHKSARQVEEVLSSGNWHPLNDDVRNFMESRFDHDFGQVRIHTDERAVRSTAALNSHAYTIGNHIAFGRNQYVPNTDTGRQLIAHELTHVVQQRAAAVPEIQRQTGGTEELHGSLVERYLLERGLRPPRGQPLDGIQHTEDFHRWLLTRGDVSPPVRTPVLTAIQGPFNVSACQSVNA